MTHASWGHVDTNMRMCWHVVAADPILHVGNGLSEKATEPFNILPEVNF